MKKLLPGSRIVDSRNTWRRGTVASEVSASEDSDRYFVVYDNDPKGVRYERDRRELFDADDVYIDLDGAALTPMNFPESVRTIYAMACRYAAKLNVIRTPGLLPAALETMEHIVRQAGATADFGVRPVGARTWPDRLTGVEGPLDPSFGSDALRICIAAAAVERELVQHPATRRRLGQSIHVAKDLVALYSFKLDEMTVPVEEPQLSP